MLSHIFKTVLVMSVSGGLFAVALMLLSPVLRRILNPRLHYYITLAAVAVLLIPVSFGNTESQTPKFSAEQVGFTSEATDTAPNSDAAAYESYHIEINDKPNVNNGFLKALADKGQDSIPYLAVVWSVVLMLMLCSKTEGYISFIKELSKNSRPADKPDNFPDRLNVRVTEMLQSPMITGLFRPTLYMPDNNLTPYEQQLIIKHELVHYRRCDVAFKWLIVIAGCIHWFNPIVYILSRYIERECEASCDFEATRTMSYNDKKRYMHTLVDMIERDTAALSFGAQMSAEKSGLMLRIKAIKHKKSVKWYIRTASALCTAIVVLSGIYASGAVNQALKMRLTSAAEPDNITTSLHHSDENGRYFAESDITDSKNGGNKENHSIDVQDDDSNADDGNILYDETITQNVFDDNNTESSTEVSAESGDKTEYSAQQDISGSNAEASSDVITEPTDENDRNLKSETFGTAAETDGNIYGIYYVPYNGETPVIEGKYTSQNGCLASEKNLSFGKDGKFYIYFKANMDTVMHIEIFDSETHGSCGGYNVPSGNGKAYMFDGFDPNRKYDIEIKSESGSDWRVEGIYYIY